MKESCMSLDPLDTVRIGIIGPSWWVNYWHLAAIQTHPDAAIVAISGEQERDAEEVRAKYGPTARYYTDMNAMLDHATLDGVIVCTPNDLHHPATMAVLTRDLHVTCEKPLALNAAQAREMADEAKKRNLLGMTNFPYRDNPCVQKFRQLLAEGYIGTPMTVSGCYHGGFGLRNSPNWRGKRDRSGAGILGDLGSHLIDLARFITGEEFTAVAAHTLTTLWPDGTDAAPLLVRTEDPRVGNRNDDSCAFLAEFESGMQGNFHTSWVTHQGVYRQQQEIEVCGTEGRLHFLATHAGTFLRQLKPETGRWEDVDVPGIMRPEDAEEENEDYFRPGRHTPTNTTYRWIEAIRTGQAHVSPDLKDGWRAQQVIDAVIQASAERYWVSVGTEAQSDEKRNP
jgi:predicted dehydrogenase